MLLVAAMAGDWQLSAGNQQIAERTTERRRMVGAGRNCAPRPCAGGATRLRLRARRCRRCSATLSLTPAAQSAVGGRAWRCQAHRLIVVGAGAI